MSLSMTSTRADARLQRPLPTRPGYLEHSRLPHCWDEMNRKAFVTLTHSALRRATIEATKSGPKP
jgi:hypothetical protein